MPKRTLFLVLILGLIGFLLLSSCATAGKPAPAERKDSASSVSRTPAETVPVRTPRELLMADTSPRGRVPVFYGVSPRLSNRSAERDLCLEDAAAQASKYFALKAEARLIKERTGIGSLVVSDVSVNYDINLADSLKESLSIVEEYQDSEGTYMIISLPSYNTEIKGIASSFIRGQPAWILQPPVIPGYLVGVGASPRKRLFSDSIKAADEKAMEELVKQVSIKIAAGETEYTAQGMGTYLNQSGVEYSKAVLSGFYVLARFRSADGNNYYTLAVCNAR